MGRYVSFVVLKMCWNVACDRLDDSSLTNSYWTLSQLEKITSEQKAVQALYTILEYFDAGSVENIKVRKENARGEYCVLCIILFCIRILISPPVHSKKKSK